MGMGIRTRMACLGVGAVIGLSAATQIVAWKYQYQAALGWGFAVGKPSAITAPDTSNMTKAQKRKAMRAAATARVKAPARIYPPWTFLIWQKKWGQDPKHKATMSMGVPALMLGVALGAMLIRLFDTGTTPKRSGGLHNGKRRRPSGWGDVRDLIKDGLGSREGVILGCIDKPIRLKDWIVAPKLLVSPDLRPVLVTGGTRSGKGRGVVVPTLLNWNFSALIFDPKGELWEKTGGHRQTIGHALFFNPRHGATARFNPLAEISMGPECVAGVQRLVNILVSPQGQTNVNDFWDRQGAEMLAALIVHVLHSESKSELKDNPQSQKSLIDVKRLTANLDETVRSMLTTWHICDNRGQGMCHPFVEEIATAYAATHEKGRKSVQMTVRSYLSWLVGADVEKALSASDFRLGDLMCAKRPVSLYVQISPGDLKALQPLVRMFFQLASTAFTTHITTDSDGRPKENALLLALDEFPLLGRVDFFEDVVRLASGYGIKCLFIAQSLNDVSRVYGVHNGFIDNAHIYVAFAALDPLTREKVSKLTGMVTEIRSSASLPHHYGERGGSTSIGEFERPLLDAGEVGALPDKQQLVFIAGHRPYLLPKLHYDKVWWLKARSAIAPRDQSDGVDSPERPSHPWAAHKPFGYGDPTHVKFSEDVTRERQTGAGKSESAESHADSDESVMQRRAPRPEDLALWQAAYEKLKQAREPITIVVPAKSKREASSSSHDVAPNQETTSAENAHSHTNGHDVHEASPSSGDIMASLRSGDF
jgi:type IV secretion system protein VirD4